MGYFVLVFVFLDFLFIVLHFVWGVQGVSLLHLDREHNFPTAYQGVQLFTVAALAAAYAWLQARRGIRRAIPWALLAALFAYLSVDDLAEIHENVTYAVNRQWSFMQSPLLIFQPSMIKWMVIYTPFIFLGVALFFTLLWSLRRAPRRAQLFFFLGCIFFVSVPGLEWIGAIARKTTFYLVPSTIEEIFELVGQTSFLIALATLVRQEFHEQFQPRVPS